MSDKALVAQQTNQLAAANPQAEVERAREMARVLQDVVRQAGLAKKLGKRKPGQPEPKEHLMFEAWQTIGRFFGVSPEVEWSRPITHNGRIIGWEARAVVRDREGRVIASAESMCAKDETKWASSPAYAVRSMAQTRASAKALRQAFAWVAVLAGYSPTPAEEMESLETQTQDAEVIPTPPDDEPIVGKKPWTDEQRARIWAMLKQRSFTSEEAKKFMAWALEMSGESEWTEPMAELLMRSIDDMVADYDNQKETGGVR